jgi:hypothetical protein
MMKLSERLNDRIGLLLAGIIASAAAWFFWRYLGDSAVSVLSLILIVGLSLDNRRLRAQLRSIEQGKPAQ